MQNIFFQKGKNRKMSKTLITIQVQHKSSKCVALIEWSLFSTVLRVVLFVLESRHQFTHNKWPVMVENYSKDDFLSTNVNSETQNDTGSDKNVKKGECNPNSFLSCTMSYESKKPSRVICKLANRSRGQPTGLKSRGYAIYAFCILRILAEKYLP